MVADVRPWLSPLGLLYGEIMRVRNWLYDYRIFQVAKLPQPVIAVGNLTVGGTGKTPVVMFLIEELLRRGLKPAVVARGYGRAGTDVARVDCALSDAASRFGDEPVMMASRYPNLLVVVGASRVAAAREALRLLPEAVVIADDAFQHRSLARDLDVVVIDSTQSRSSLKPLPWGLGREWERGLSRAGLVILNKTNLAGAGEVERWRHWLRDAGWPSERMVEAEYRLAGLIDRDGRPVSSSGKWRAAAAIGRPETFRRMLEVELGLNITGSHWFRDHHPFRADELRKLLGNLAADERLVVTEKDWIKICGLAGLDFSKIVVAALKLQVVRGREVLERAVAAVSR